MLSRSKLLRRFGRALTITALLSFGMGAPIPAAQLQPEPRLGSRIPIKPDRASGDQTRVAKRKYAACVVAKQPKLASAFVLDRTTLGLDRRFDELRDGECLLEATGSNFEDVGLRLKGDTMRFAIAEALLQGEINSIDPARLASAAQLQLPLLKAADYEPTTNRSYSMDEMKALDESRARDQMSLIIYRFGDCVVRSDARGSRALLLATAGSDSEGAAFQSLMPSFGGCLEKGAQLKFDRDVLRGAIAFGYYSLAHAPQQTASAAR